MADRAKLKELKDAGVKNLIFDGGEDYMLWYAGNTFKSRNCNSAGNMMGLGYV